MLPPVLSVAGEVDPFIDPKISSPQTGGEVVPAINVYSLHPLADEVAYTHQSLEK